MKAVSKLIDTLVAVVLIATFVGCSTTERHEQSHGGHHAPPTDQPAANVPEKAADVFREAEKHLQQLAEAVQKKDARAAHQHDSAIRALMGRIAQRATPASKVDSEELAGEISNAARAAHRSAHDDQWNEAAAHVKHGQASLAKLKAKYKETPH